MSRQKPDQASICTKKYRIAFSGMNYALLEMKLTAIALLRAFKFHTTVKLENVKMNMGFLMTSLDGYRMSITLR